MYLVAGSTWCFHFVKSKYCHTVIYHNLSEEGFSTPHLRVQSSCSLHGSISVRWSSGIWRTILNLESVLGRFVSSFWVIRMLQGPVLLQFNFFSILSHIFVKHGRIHDGFYDGELLGPPIVKDPQNMTFKAPFIFKWFFSWCRFSFQSSHEC